MQFLKIMVFILLGSFVATATVAETRTKLSEELRIFVNIGDKFKKNKEYDLALEQYRRAEAREPNNTVVMGRIVETIRDKFIKRKKGYNDIGLVKTDKTTDSLDEALIYIFKAQSIDPKLETHPSWVLNEAYFQRAREHNDQAIQSLEDALKIYPDHAELSAELGKLKLITNATGQADEIELIKQALDANPNNNRYCYYLGRAYDKKEKNELAFNTFSRCVLLLEPTSRLPYTSDEPQVWKDFNRGSAYWIMNYLDWLQADFEAGVLTSDFKVSIADRLKYFEIADSLIETKDSIKGDQASIVRSMYKLLFNLKLGRIEQAMNFLNKLVIERKRWITYTTKHWSRCDDYLIGFLRFPDSQLVWLEKEIQNSDIVNVLNQGVSCPDSD